MSWRNYLTLFVITITLNFFVMLIQSMPGYMDDSYYYLGGVQLARGEGFSEPILWNYLDNPIGIPHPSHGYWMPFASMIAATGMWFTGIHNFAVGRSGFFILAIFIPIVTASLSYQLSRDTYKAMISGFLAIFSGSYLPYVTTTDNFTIYLFFGGILFLLLPKMTSGKTWVAASIGMITGIIHLSRSEGILWFPLVTFLLVWNLSKSRAGKTKIIKTAGILLIGYCVIMLPWFIRNLSVFGTLLSPGGLKTVWLTNSNEFFSFSSDHLTFQRWWEAGIVAILNARLEASGMNLMRAFIEQGMIFLSPLIILGLWKYRSDIRIQTGFWAWLLTFGLMTIVFPFSGSRGGFFHSCAAIQPLFWAIAPIGLDVFTGWGARVRSWNQKQANQVFGIGAVIFTIILTVFIYTKRVIGSNLDNILWEQTNAHYVALEFELKDQSGSRNDIVMVKDPPSYYVANNRTAIVIPDGDIQTLISAAGRYGGRFILLDQSHPDGLSDLYDNPHDTPAGLQFLQTLDETHIFEVK